MSERTPRPYLPAAERRRRLLDAAARCFAREGYGGLTMVALAAEAGVSRRLVYNHFPDLATLYEAYFDDRTRRYLDAIDDAVAAGGLDRRAAFTGAFRHLLAMPADDQRAIRALLTDPGLPELASLQARVRAHVEARWLAPFRARVDDPALARALLWTTVNGLFGLADVVARGEIGTEAAVQLASALVGAAPSTITTTTPTTAPTTAPAAG
jgi:AcrR family transcriptional regulator